MSITNFERTKNWLIACGKEPNAENLSVQMGCHIEELVEFLECINISDFVAAHHITEAATTLKAVASQIKKRFITAVIDTEKREEVLDALCDSEVTGNGVAFLAGFGDSRRRQNRQAGRLDGS